MMLMTWILSLVSAIGVTETGIATIYGYPGDKYNPYNQYACKRRIIAQQGYRSWMHAVARGVAHRNLPCGQSVRVCNIRNGLCSDMIVVDRGPYGAKTAHGWQSRPKKLYRGESYRGILDLLPSAAQKINHNGKEAVTLWSPRKMY